MLSDKSESVARSNRSRWLALLPVTAAVLALLLMMPRAAPPEEIPLPRVDARAQSALRKDDADRAASARATRLRGDVLEVGTALRALNRAQVSHGTAEDLEAARRLLERAVEAAVREGPIAADALRTLRAVQLEGFLAEVERFEASGRSSEELEELGGPFLDHMASAGWLRGGKVLLDDAARRAAYKLVWNAQTGADRLPELALALDEERALYAFYLTHPHAAEAQRMAHDNARSNATDRAACERAIAREKLDVEQWRVEKIRRLGAIDPSYPTAYALGVAFYRAGRFDLSIDAFRAWTDRHPDGPLTLRARNHMKAAVAVFGPS